MSAHGMEAGIFGDVAPANSIGRPQPQLFRKIIGVTSEDLDFDQHFVLVNK